MNKLDHVIIEANNYTISDTGVVRNRCTGYVLKHKIDRDGYHCVRLINNEGKGIERFVARLVAIHFIPNPMNLETVNHKNGNKDKNDLIELEWLSRGDNTRHGMETGLIPKKAPLLRNDIHQRLHKGDTIADIQKDVPICTNSITAERKRLGIKTHRGNELAPALKEQVRKAIKEKRTYAWIYTNLDVSPRCTAKIKKQMASECNDQECM